LLAAQDPNPRLNSNSLGINGEPAAGRHDTFIRARNRAAAVRQAVNSSPPATSWSEPQAQPNRHRVRVVAA
jgi:hypothetical protein